MSTPDTVSEMEDRLRAALTARAEQVRPEDLAPLTPVVELRPRWQSPWVLLATAAVVLLVLGAVFQGVTGRQRSDDVAPNPDAPQVTLPTDIGRDWKADDLSSTARLDLDGDGTREKVVFLSEPTEDFDGRVRLETTLSSTGERAYGIARLGTTIGVSPLGVIDADDDGDEELVLYYDDRSASGPGGYGYPLVFDLRDGLLVQAAVEQPELLVRGDVQEPGSQTEFYDLVRQHAYEIRDGELYSTVTRNAFARGNMTLMRPETVVLDQWRWVLGEGDVLRPEEAGCRTSSPEAERPCAPGEVDDLPVVSPVASAGVGEGEQATYDDGFRYTARVAGGEVEVELGDGRRMRLVSDIDDPVLSARGATGVFFDGASLFVTSASDPSQVAVVVQRGDTLQVMEPVGEVPLGNGGDIRSWLTANGAVVTAVADGEAWQTWEWHMVTGRRIAALPTGTVCFDDVDDPSTVRRC